MNILSKKCLAAVLAITFPIWVIPFIFIGLLVIGIQDLYKAILKELGVE